MWTSYSISKAQKIVHSYDNGQRTSIRNTEKRTSRQRSIHLCPTERQLSGSLPINFLHMRRVSTSGSSTLVGILQPME